MIASAAGGSRICEAAVYDKSVGHPLSREERKEKAGDSPALSVPTEPPTRTPALRRALLCWQPPAVVAGGVSALHITSTTRLQNNVSLSA